MSNKKLGMGIKTIVGGASAIGSMIIVKHGINKLIPVNTGKVTKIFINLGTAAIASLVGDLAAGQVIRDFDRFAEAVENTKALKKNIEEPYPSQDIDFSEDIDYSEDYPASEEYSYDLSEEDFDRFAKAVEKEDDFDTEAAKETLIHAYDILFKAFSTPSPDDLKGENADE